MRKPATGAATRAGAVAAGVAAGAGRGGAEGAATETGDEGRSGDAATAPANKTGVRMAIPNAGTRVARLTLRLLMISPRLIVVTGV